MASRDTEPRKPPPGVSPDVAGVLARALAERPDAEALIGRHGRYTYRALDRAADAAAAALESLGIRPGDRVAASAGNCPEIVIAFLAAMRLGAVWVGVASMLAGPEKAHQLRDSGAVLYLADRQSAAQVGPLRERVPALGRIVDMETGAADSEWAALLARFDGKAASPRRIDPLAPAAIAYTSGSSGFPKGATHSQHNLMVAVAATLTGARGHQGPPDMRRGATIPLAIVNVMVLVATVALAGGGTLVCVDRRDAAGIAEWIGRERIQHVNLSGAHLHDLLSSGTPPAALASLVAANNAGAGISVDLRERFRKVFGVRVHTSYGLAEVPTSVATFSRDDDFVEGSGGRVNAHVEIAILDPDGAPLPIGGSGEICIRTPRAGDWAGIYRPMLGYWNNPEATAAALRGGWLHTGDHGALDERGYLHIRGRIGEVILRGGANVYPAEIERVLQADPHVRDVAVIGVADERLGERVAAVVELEAGAARETALPALVARCEGELARYKLPAEWHFVDEMPRTGINKIARAELKARFGGR